MSVIELIDICRNIDIRINSTHSRITDTQVFFPVDISINGFKVAVYIILKRVQH